MRLSSSSGDFGEYVVRVEEKVEYFKDTKFRYVNLEQSGRRLEEFCREVRKSRRVCKRYLRAVSRAVSAQSYFARA